MGKFMRELRQKEFWLWVAAAAVVFLAVPIILLCAKKDTFPWMFYGDTIAFMVLGIVDGIRMKDSRFLTIAFYLLYMVGIWLPWVKADRWEAVDSVAAVMLMGLHFFILLLSMYEGKRLSGGVWKKQLERFKQICTQKEFCIGMVIGGIVFFVVPAVMLYTKVDMFSWMIFWGTITLLMLGFIAGIREKDRWIRCGVFGVMYVAGLGLFCIIPLFLETIHTEYFMLAVLFVFIFGVGVVMQLGVLLIGVEAGSLIGFLARKINASRADEKER